MKMLLLVLATLTTTLCMAQDSTELPKKKMIKKVVTYEEVDDNSDKSVSEKTPSSNAHLDVLAGLANPVGDEVEPLSARFGYGAQFLFNATPDLLIGAYYTTSSGSMEDFESVDVRLSYYGLVTQYKLSSIAFLQFKAGLSNITASAEEGGQAISISAAENPFTVSAGLGLDFPITNTISFAPYASYTNSFAAGSGDDEVKSYGLIEVMGALRFNF